MTDYNLNFQCPKCQQWIAVLATTPDEFLCPWCKAKLRKTLAAYTDETQREMMVTQVTHGWSLANLPDQPTK